MRIFLDNLFQKLNFMKIRNQLLIIYLLAIMLPVLLLGAYLVSNTRNLVMQLQISNTSSENIRVENVLRELTDTVYDVSDSISYDTQLKSLISTKYPNSVSFVRACQNYSSFDSYINDYSSGIANIQLYVDNKTITDNVHFIKETDEIKSTEWFKKSSNNWGVFWQPMTDSNGNTYMSLVRKIILYNGDYAILVINVRPSYLNSMVENEPLLTVASIDHGTIILSTNVEDVGQSLNQLIPPKSILNSGIINNNGNKILTVSKTFYPSNSEDSIVVTTLNENAFNRTDDVTFICCIILLIAIIIPFILIILFSNIFSTRINKLRNVMNKVAEGDLYVATNLGGKDEISELYTDLNVMVESIKNLIKEVYTEKLMKEKLNNSQQKIEFKMLASQINPHFLYNTLETIRMKVLSNGDKEAANVIKILGKSMRRMLETKDELVTLDSELEFIKYYLEIQKFRFGDRAEYEINIDSNVNVETCYILPLLLQPIVENAFVHGLEDKDGGGKIKITIFYKNDRLGMLIEDNGVGMTDTVCANLINKMRDVKDSTTKNGIGICNVYQRIKLYYGNEFGIDITSQFGVGTKVYVYLPENGNSVVKNNNNL